MRDNKGMNENKKIHVNIRSNRILWNIHKSICKEIIAGELIAIEANKAIAVITNGHLHSKQVNRTMNEITIDDTM